MPAADDSGILVIGQLARDLVLAVDALPEGGGSAVVTERREVLGGKGANQAVGLRQLGQRVALLAVAGDDPAGDDALAQARADGIDVAGVVRRGTTALLVDVVEASGTRRLLEDVPESSLLTEADVAAASAFDGADTVCLQLQQPADALLTAAESTRDRGARLVVDGDASGDSRDRLLALADVVRMDAVEAELMTGAAVASRADARRAAAVVLDAGAALAAVAVPGEGDLVAWREGAGSAPHPGAEFVPHRDEHVVDPTGAGDAFLAGLVTALRRGDPPDAAARFASAAAGATVARLGGRPDLSGLRRGAAPGRSPGSDAR